MVIPAYFFKAGAEVNENNVSVGEVTLLARRGKSRLNRRPSQSQNNTAAFYRTRLCIEQGGGAEDGTFGDGTTEGKAYDPGTFGDGTTEGKACELGVFRDGTTKCKAREPGTFGDGTTEGNACELGTFGTLRKLTGRPSASCVRQSAFHGCEPR